MREFPNSHPMKGIPAIHLYLCVSVRLISKDLTAFFKNAHHVLSFLHVPTFLG